jgi:hypothetical protein
VKFHTSTPFIVHKNLNFNVFTPQTLFMEISNLPDNPSDLKALLKAKEKYYYEAIKNNVKFDKIKALQESITELKSLLSKRKKR